MSDSKINIGILGIGAIGSAISCLLKENILLNLHFYNRTPKDNFRVLSKGIESKILVADINNFHQELDWLIICLKEHQYESAAPAFLKLVRPHTKLVSIRNGLHHKDSLLKFIGEENILECIIDCPTQKKKDNVYERLKKPIFILPKSKLAQDFGNLFQSRDVTIVQTLDFNTACWKKVCESSALGAILCLSGETCWIFEDKEILELYKAVLEESIQVAMADGAKIEETFFNKMIEKLISYPHNKSSSMLIDRLNGNPIELGAKNGIIVKIGRQKNVPTPINDMFVRLLKKTNNTPLNTRTFYSS